MKRFFQVSGLLTAGAVIVIIFAVLYCIQRSMEVARDAYAVEWVAGMVIEHLKANDNEWPNEWEDLRDDYERMAKEYGHPWSFESLRGRVAIDFDVCAAELASANQSATGRPFNVVYLRSGSRTHWEAGEPNTLILEYLTRSRNQDNRQ